MISASFGVSRLWRISEDRISQFICMHTAKNGCQPRVYLTLQLQCPPTELLTQYLGLWVQIIKQKNLIELGVLPWSPAMAGETRSNANRVAPSRKCG